jgi:WD40 repeat protein
MLWIRNVVYAVQAIIPRLTWTRWVHLVTATLLLVALVSCSQTSTRQSAHQGQNASQQVQATVKGLPSFTDWRPSYLASSGYLQVTSMNGQGTLTGPEFSGLTIDGYVVGSAGVSPNGHFIAYSGTNGLRVIDLTGHQTGERAPAVSAEELAWSPDSTRIALGDGQGHIGIANIGNGDYTVAPNSQHQGLRSVIGWIDDSHLAVTMAPASTDTQSQQTNSITLGSLDISSWSVRAILSISFSGLNIPLFALSPDRAHVLFFNRRFREDAYTPTVAEIDVASGALNQLPRIAASMGSYSGFTSLAWQPQGQMIAATTGYDVNGDLETWLLNLEQDSAVRLALPQPRYVAAWVPDTSQLILTTGWQILVNDGPYEISEASIDLNDPSASMIPVSLTSDASTFPFVGLVRTD